MKKRKRKDCSARITLHVRIQEALALACRDMVDGMIPPGKPDAKEYEKFYVKEAGK